MGSSYIRAGRLVTWFQQLTAVIVNILTTLMVGTLREAGPLIAGDGSPKTDKLIFPYYFSRRCISMFIELLEVLMEETLTEPHFLFSPHYS